MSKKLKTGLIIGGILIFLALVGMLSGGENTNTETNIYENNSQQEEETEEATNYSNTLTYSKLVDTTLDGISEYLDLEPTV